MTVVYGVTFVGGRLQVEKQLKDIGLESEILFKASVYIVQGVFKSLTEIFTTARQIQVCCFETIIYCLKSLNLAYLDIFARRNFRGIDISRI